MNIEIVEGRYAVCRLDDPSGVAEVFWHTDGPVFVAKSHEEVSLICRSDDVPGSAAQVEDGWAMMRLPDPLDFALVGVIARITAILSEAQIPVVVASTYLTDYILVKTDRLSEAAMALRSGEFSVVLARRR
ncbi:MAG: ACT domain-containing protein [Propionibacteriaceae bacterium]|jgi:hypothetical protein|nr:ACT domain-containing protein [Propionibacteriaceae bacterium]